MVPILRRSPQRNRIGIVRPNALHEILSPPRMRLLLVAAGLGKFKGELQLSSRNETAALRVAGRRRYDDECDGRSAVAQAVGGAFPLRDIVGDHAGGFHRGLAELGIAGDLALDALAFGMQQVAQAFEFGDQVFDFGERGSGDALDQRVDVVDGGLGSRARARRLGAASSARRRAAQIGDVVAHEIADAGFDFRDRGEIGIRLRWIRFFQNEVAFIGCSPVSR